MSTYRFDVAMKEANRVDRADRPQHLSAQPHCGAHAEAAFRLAASQLRQVLALQRHHDVVEAIVAATPKEVAHVVLPCDRTGWIWY